MTRRSRCSYNTTSHKIRQVKTPGGRLVAHFMTKVPKAPHCKETGKPLGGIPCLRPIGYKRLNKRQRTVDRAYGGVLSHSALKERIVRAFLTEEVKVIKKKMRASKSK